MRECDDQYPWLAEFLTEYVDGTMDPAARAAFEECLRGNPALMGYVERLRLTRRVLCGYGCGIHAPCNLHEQLHARLLREGLLQPGTPDALTASPDAPPAQTPTPALRVTLVLIACAMGVVLFTARPAPEQAAPVAAQPAEALRLRTPPATTVPVSAHMVYAERRVPTRADSIQRARHLAERSARRIP